MSALGNLIAAFAAPSQEENSPVAFQLSNNATSLTRHLDELATKPVTVAQYLGVVPIDHGIDFTHYDGLLARADKILRNDPDAVYIEHGVAIALAGPADALRSALIAADSYRRIARP